MTKAEQLIEQYLIEGKPGIEQLGDIAGSYNGKFKSKSKGQVTYKFGSAVASEDFEDSISSYYSVTVSKDGREVTVHLE